ncbi:MAG TPA: M23 family metallopeptidase [Chitinophagaceae bacterium]|nr:M23 family metallopeptidase [Chitinophagaceae bacterium]
MNIKSLILLFLLITPSVFAQKSLTDWVQETKSDFRSPLNIPLFLAGNFGECRPNHFHTGLDLKTNQKENLEVFAVADGFISRISMSHTGYGHCLYVTHPNGLTSVYAHLNTFSPAIQNYLEKHQEKNKKWNIDISIEEGILPIKKGEQIALSGNTGGSVAPHLHFEIRETGTNQALNPSAFPAFQVQDKIAPKPSKIAIYNAQESLYKQSPDIYSLIAQGNNKYTGDLIITNKDKVFFSLEVKDFMNGSNNWLGIYSIKLFLNDSLHFQTKIDKIDLSINRMMNSYIDYVQYANKKSFFQLLYILPNNHLQLYPISNNNGAIKLREGKQKIRIEIEDYYTNKSSIQFEILKKQEQIAEESTKLKYNYKNEELIPGLFQNFTKEYFYLNSKTLSVYDTITFKYKEKKEAHLLSPIITINAQEFPIHEAMELGIRLLKPLPLHLRSKLIFSHPIQASSLPGQAAQNAIPAKFEKGYAIAPIQSFGHYHVAIDTVAPKISVLSRNQLKPGDIIRIQVEEESTYIASFEAKLEDGSWLNMRRAKNIFYYKIPLDFPRGKHNVQIEASDANQNVQKQQFELNIQ